MNDSLKKFGYDLINWNAAHENVVNEVLSLYLKRLTTSQIDFTSVDNKGKYALSGMLGLTSALLVWASKVPIGDTSSKLILFSMVCGFALATICFAISLWPRPMCGNGVTPTRMNLAEWKDKLEAPDSTGLRSLKGEVICQYADNIECNEDTVTRKSFWVRGGMVVRVGTLVLSSILFAFYLIGAI